MEHHCTRPQTQHFTKHKRTHCCIREHSFRSYYGCKQRECHLPTYCGIVIIAYFNFFCNPHKTKTKFGKREKTKKLLLCSFCLFCYAKWEVLKLSNTLLISIMSLMVIMPSGASSKLPVLVISTKSNLRFSENMVRTLSSVILSLAMA